MANKLPLLVLIVYALLLTHRLPDWHSNLTIWEAAQRTDSNDPWALNNAAHYRHEANRLPESLRGWNAAIRLPIAPWLPDIDRWPYLTAAINLQDFYVAQGDWHRAGQMAELGKRMAPSIVPHDVGFHPDGSVTIIGRQ